MQNRTIGIIATVFTALFCGCFSIISCVWGVIIARGMPVDVTSGGATSPQTFPPAIGFGLLCLSAVILLVPIAVGFFTLRKKPEIIPVDVPPAS